MGEDRRARGLSDAGSTRGPALVDDALVAGRALQRFLLDGVEHVLVMGQRSALLRALSPAERGVVEQVRCGRSNDEIAALRGVSARTVANQLAAAFRKLGVGSRAQLVALLAIT
ncbi:MAG: helix-turn-helix transcriptional regulator [Sandaracinaceae bacterium]|nr:helix-turn-helix transcriptional regulator [Sandaracinaceae bacterium]